MLLRFKDRLAHLPLNHSLSGGPIANKSESAREGSCPGSVCQVPSLASRSPTKHTDFGPFHIALTEKAPREPSGESEAEGFLS